MTAQIGMPVQYTSDGSSVHPALVENITSGVVSRIIWPAGGTPQWQDSPTGLVRDDTLTTPNSWAPITYTGSVTIQSGV